jgi:YidC/Oxa1 family membrane protein insertase
VAAKIVSVIKEAAPDLFDGNSFYGQMTAAPLISQFAEQIKAALPDLSQTTLAGINFSFLGIDLAATPTFNIFTWDSYSWANIGAFLLPLLSAGSQVVSMLINQSMNNSLVTNERGVQDKETAKESTANQQNKTMLIMMPLMSLWIGFTIPAALSLYWLVQGIVTTVIDLILTKKYRKIYDAEDAERLKKALAADAIEAEKERLRAEKRAANPDGITENTSKKKLQQIKQREQEAAKRDAAKEYAQKKGIEIEEDSAPDVLSGDPSRPFCKGRAYDPNRYASGNTEE